ncbi:hypothetical protein CISG_09323 [Coccidioides immitis RMSCC 3703]|uniref:Uncharacterized protein n=1 Tax=Coccidioides immitis RMSCC 3703 TaxID=454286 RepID=A0A0J8RAR1_COCIT|nr:hypothetical protein CISG_09323 [Coccidioides immitis RMSCC 3703]
MWKTGLQEVSDKLLICSLSLLSSVTSLLSSSLREVSISLFTEDIEPSSVVASLSSSSPSVVTTFFLPAQASSAALSPPPVIVAPAPARNIVVAVSSALAGFVDAVVL